VLFDWLTRSLPDGLYNLKVEFINWGGLSGERLVEGLTKKTKPERFGIKVNPQFGLPEIIVSTRTQKVRGSFGQPGGVVIVDDRLIQPGWTLTARFRPLYSPQADHFIRAVDLLTVEPQPVEAVEGSLDGVQAGAAVTITSSDQVVVVSQARSGAGRGIYRQDLVLDWIIPANTPAGDYTGQITFTLQ